MQSLGSYADGVSRRSLAADRDTMQRREGRGTVATFDRDRLTSLFPDLEWDSPTVVRCTESTRGEGRYVKASGRQPRYGQVSIVCSPAFVLSVKLEHHWPDDVSTEERAALDEALLGG